MVSDNPETFADLDGHGCGTALDNQGSIACSNPGQSSPPPPGNGPNTGTGTGQSTSQQAVAGQQQNQAQQQNQNQDQQQQQSQNPADQQLVQLQQQVRQQSLDAINGPQVGSEEYATQLTNEVAAESSSGEKTILAPAAVLEGIGVAVLVAGSETAVATYEMVGDVASTAKAASANAALRTGVAIETTVSGGATAVSQFTQAALFPTKAAPTTAGMLSLLANATVRAISQFF
jgi:hypothetical protein